METLVQDIRYALRMLRKAPVFTAVVVITLALGIGANTALFSVVDAVLLRPLAYQQPEQLVAVKTDMPGINLTDRGMSQPELEDFQKRSGVFTEISAVWPISANITGREKPERVEANAVSTNFFTLLAAKPALGRVFNDGDYRPGFSEGAVISDSLWHKMFGADPHILGQVVRLDTDLYTIIGVMPPEFRHPGRTLRQDVEIWVAAGYAADPFPHPPVRTQRFIPGAIARLQPGMTMAQAQSRLNAFAMQLREQYPTDYPATVGWRVQLVPLQQEVVGNVSVMLFLLLAAVGAVLLIACVNIASLLLARSSVRHREIAVRQALGAGTWRLVRQTLTESVVLSLCGGLLAIPLTFWLKNILLAFVPSSLPRMSEVTVNGRTLLFVVAVSVITGLLFGLAPAFQMSHWRLMEKLNQGARGVGIASRQHRFLRGLVVSEFALSLVLMVGAGLLLRSFWKALEVQPGFNSDNLVTAQFWLPVPNDPNNNPYPTQEKLNVFMSEVLRRVGALPGVKEVAIGGGVTPLSVLMRNAIAFNIEGRITAAGETPTAELGVATPDLFHTLQTPLIRGRFFTESDDDKGEPVVLIDQTAAERYWPHEDPLGRQVQLQVGRKQQMWRIVGIVGRARSDGLDAPYAPHLFVPARQIAFNSITVYARTSASPEALVGPIRREVQAVNPDLPVFGVRSVRSVISDSLASRRFTMQVLGFFAATALLLAAIGIYGVMAYFVSQRVREIGVRMALGAQRGDVLKLVVRQGMSLALMGVVIGLAASLLLMRLIAGLLFGVSATDPVTLVIFTALLAAVALLANYIPASRAARIDPMVALRQD
jgi:putative ABC transport system permease protein